MTAPRPVPPGTTWLVTRRCTQREHWLVPRGEVPEIVGFNLAEAVERHGIQLHHAICMSNHVHMVLTDPEGVLPDFMHDFLVQTARALNAKYVRKENLWASGTYSAVRLEDAEDVMRKLVYSAVNAVDAGLVATPAQWPGLRTLPGDVLLKKGRKFERVGKYLNAWRKRRGAKPGDRPEFLHLPITVPPQFPDDTPAEFAKKFQAAVNEAVEEIHAAAKKKNQRFGTAAQACKTPCGSRPETPREPLWSMNPTLAAADTGRRVAMIRELQRFRHEYRQAYERWLTHGHLEAVTFPYGTFQMRRYANVQVATGPP